MTITAPGSLEIFDVIQGSDEWLELRRGIVTASTVGQIITPLTLKVAANAEARSLTAQLAAERITGHVEPTYHSSAMWRGVDDEPRAREHYREHYAPVVEVGFMRAAIDAGHMVGYSPDGLVGDDGLIEIKSREPKHHVTDIVADVVPREHMAQIQCGLLVSGREWCDYLSYCGGMPMWRKRVEPDHHWFHAILTAIDTVEDAIATMLRDYERAVEGLPLTERITYTDEIRVA